MPTFSLNTQLNPESIISVSGFFSRIHTPVRRAIAFLASHVLQQVDAGKVIESFSKEALEKVWIEMNPDKQGLSIDFKNPVYAAELDKELKKIGFQRSSHDGQGKFSISSADDNQTNQVHQEIGRFVLYVLGTWKIESHSYLRDLYCAESGDESGIKADKQIKKELANRFKQVHWMHVAVDVAIQTERTLKSSAFFFKAFDGANPYITINLMIHMMRLQANQNPVQASNAEFAMNLIDQGDLFYAINNMSDKTVIINAANAFRIGGAEIYGASGSIEEMLCRMSNLLNVIKDEVNKEDPMYQLVHDLLHYVQPNGHKITVPAGRGIPSGVIGAVIDEYIPADLIHRYQSLATKMLRASKEMSDSYHQHFVDGGWVSVANNVAFYQKNAAPKHATVINMVGIDGREPGMAPAFLSFPEEYTVAKDYWIGKAFAAVSAKEEYGKRWTIVLKEILEIQPKQVLCIAVGAGAFDPTKEAYFTRASADGFAEAYMSLHKELHASAIQFDFIFRDTQKRDPSTYALFKHEIEKVDALMLANQQQVTRM